MNTINLIGNLGNDPETKQVGGTTITEFSLAVRRGFKDKQGNYPTDWLRCKAWGKTGEIIGKYVKKGNQLGVTGRVEVNSYEDKNGNKRTSFDVIVSDVTFIKNGTKTQETTQEEKTKQNNNEEGDGLPF